MSTVMEQAAAVKERRQAERLAAVEALATRQAAGDGPDPDTIVEVCEAAGIDLEAYGKKVAECEKRRTDAATVATRPAFEARKTAVEAAMKTAIATFEAARKAFDESYPPMEGELREAQAGIDRCEAARGRLRNSKDPRIVNRLREINLELHALQGRSAELVKRQQTLPNDIERAQAEVSDQVSRNGRVVLGGRDPRLSVTPTDFNQRDYDRAAEALSSCRVQVSQVAAELAGLPAKVEALNRERETLFDAAERSPV